MTTSLKTQWTSVSSLEDAPISPAMLVYFQEGFRNDAHNKVLSAFLEAADKKGMTRAFIGRRLRKSPAQVTRWLGAPGNWTLETLTNLAIAMGYQPKIQLERLSELRTSNTHHPLAGKGPISVAVSSSRSGAVVTSPPPEKAWQISTSNIGA